MCLYLLCLRNLNFRLQDTSLDVYSLLFLFPFPIYFSCVALSGSVSNSYLYLKYELFGLGVGLFFFFLSGYVPLVFLFHSWCLYTIASCHLKYLSISFQSCLYCFIEYTDRIDVFTAFSVVKRILH